MSTDRDTTRIVRSWLRTEENESADRVLGTVLDRLDTTPQRRATWWPARRLPQMNNTAKLALGAAAVVVVALLGINFLLPGSSNIGGPGPSVAPEPSLAPDPTPTALRASVGEEELEPGIYVSHPIASNPSLAVTFTVPQGWQAFAPNGLLPQGDASTEGPDGMALAFFEVSGIYSDPCNSLGDPDVDGGTTAADLATAFSAQTAYEATVEDVTFAGYSGKQVELQLPSEFDDSCRQEDYFVFDGSPYAQGLSNRWHLTILDIEGSRLVIFSQDFAGTSASDRADLQSIIESIQIEIED
jgi:hypothetical protein